MRLCHIVPSLEERYGGPSQSVRALSHALAQNGHQVDLLATATQVKDLAVASAGRLRTAIYPRGWPQRFCPSRGLRRALAATDADIIHHHSLWLRTLHYAHQRAVTQRRPLIISPRGMMSAWAWQHRSWRKKFASRYVHPGALAAAAGWHATSTAEAREIRDLGFPQPICVAPNAVNLPLPAAQDNAAAHWHAVCPESKKRPVALFYSRFHAKKRARELIDLWCRHGPEDWLLLLVGIPQEDTPASLEAYARQLPGRTHVAAFSGLGQPAPYAVATLFLLPSHNENFGLVIAEAMAHRVPVLVTDTTPWSEVARLGLGWCVPWAEYRHALKAATTESRTQLTQRGAHAQSWVAENFSWDRSARLLTTFYEDLHLHADGR